MGSSEALKNHIPTHEGPTEETQTTWYYCDYVDPKTNLPCNKRFPTQKRLKAHKKTHEPKVGEHVCPHCEEEFANKYNLQSHLKKVCDKYDREDTSVVCPRCKDVFRHQKDLNRHWKNTPDCNPKSQ